MQSVELKERYRGERSDQARRFWVWVNCGMSVYDQTRLDGTYAGASLSNAIRKSTSQKIV